MCDPVTIGIISVVGTMSGTMAQSSAAKANADSARQNAERARQQANAVEQQKARELSINNERRQQAQGFESPIKWESNLNDGSCNGQGYGSISCYYQPFPDDSISKGSNGFAHQPCQA